MLEKHIKLTENPIKMRQHARLANMALNEAKAHKVLKNRKPLQKLFADFAVAMFTSGFIQNTRVNGDYPNLESFDIILFSITQMIKEEDLTTLETPKLVETLKNGILNSDGTNLMEDLIVARALFILANDNVYVNSMEDSAAILADSKLSFPDFEVPENIVTAMTQLEAVTYYLKALPLHKLSSKHKAA